MVRQENLEGKISVLRSYLKLLERYRPMPMAMITGDPDLRGACERYLYLASQSAIDAAEMYCKRHRLGKPDSMADAFVKLRHAAVIDDALCDRMLRMVGFRNVLSHAYENLDYHIVESVLKQHIGELETLARCLEGRCC